MICESRNMQSAETMDIICPHCDGGFTVSIYCMSMPCPHCNRHINVKEVIPLSEREQKSSIGKISLLCFKCGKEIFIDENTKAVSCNYCHHRNDLNNFKIKSHPDKNFQAHDTLYIKSEDTVEVPKIYVRNAVIMGKFKGHICASGTVAILEHGEIYGKITCRKLIIKKGGTFDGTLQRFLHDSKKSACKAKYFYQLIAK